TRLPSATRSPSPRRTPGEPQRRRAGGAKRNPPQSRRRPKWRVSLRSTRPTIYSPRFLLRGFEGDAEGGEVGTDARGQHADLGQVANQALVQIAAEEFAERGLVPARRPLAAHLPDLLDLAPVETHVLVCPEREDAAQGAVQGPDREIFHLAPLRRGGLG